MMFTQTKKTVFLFSLTLLTACRTARLQTPEAATDIFHVTATIIDNAMPSGDDPPVVRIPYVIIKVCPQNNVLSEHIRLINVTVTGKDGTWTSAKLDHTDFRGKGFTEYENVLRDFDPGFPKPYTVSVMIETESGSVKTVAITNIERWVVY